jgi:hypothetical protein
MRLNPITSKSDLKVPEIIQRNGYRKTDAKTKTMAYLIVNKRAFFILPSKPFSE